MMEAYAFPTMMMGKIFKNVKPVFPKQEEQTILNNENLIQ
jgi:hypothetical protein